MVAYLEKSEGKQFWQIATLSTTEDGVRGITATIDRKVQVFVSEASIRIHLKLEDSDGISSLPIAEIFKQLALIGNMKRASKGYSRVDIPLFPTMLTTPESSLSRITSSPSLSPQTHPSTSQPPSTPPSNQTIPITKEAAPMPHESPLQSVHSLGRDEGSLSLNELMNLCTSLSEKVESLESELKQTKQTYHAALTKLIKWVKKLEQTIKISQARRRAKVVNSNAEEDKQEVKQTNKIIQAGRRAKVVISDADEDEEDPSKQGRSLIEELDLDDGISLTANVSTANELGSTAGVKAKDKGKAIMQESEPPKKIKNRVQVQMSVDEELAKKVFEEEQANLDCKKQLDEREEVAAKVDQAHDIDWSDPAVLRYHTLQNRPFSVAEVRKNMCLYLKNQGGYKMSHFKGMSYEEGKSCCKHWWTIP
ncbi:hypothetical protein Tco_0568357 [Tanacetum coccineum]